ncbi:MAG: hypothetical protein V1738_00675 [Patescibacteria group bacterium]
MGMLVFSPQQTRPKLIVQWPTEQDRQIAPTLIGSHEAQAAPNELALNLDIDRRLDSLADTLERTIGDSTTGALATDTALQTARATNGPNEGSDEVVLSIRQSDVAAAAEAGATSVGVWKTIWNFLWPKISAMGGALKGLVT